MPRSPARIAPTARLADPATAGLASPADSHVWPGRDVEIAGTTIHVRTTPSDNPAAEPAVFVHGLGGSALNWTDLATLLRHRLAIDAIDLPGHGRSPAAVRRDYTPETNATVVVEYVEATGRGPVHLVGNSMGGLIAILVAARRPDLVRTLTLISPAVPDNRPRVYPLRHNPAGALLAVPVVGDAVLRRVAGRQSAEQRVAATIALCFADPSRYPEQRLREAVDEVRARSDMAWANEAFLRSMRGLGRSQFLRGRATWAVIREIAAPTLVVWGDRDRLVAPDLAPHVAAAISDSRLLELPDVGHVAMMEDPRTTALAIIGLLDDADEPSHRS